MILVCPICERDIEAPEEDGETFRCPGCRTNLQVFNIGGVWEVHRYMGSFKSDED